MKNTAEKSERWFNPNRQSYLASDGITYTYKAINPQTGEEERITISAKENGVTEEILDILLELDKEEDDNDFHQRHISQNESSFNRNDDTPSILDSFTDPTADVHTLAFPEKEPEHPLVKKLHKVLEEKLEPQQQKLYEQHIVHGQSFKEIKRREEAETGRVVSASGISKRWDKAFSKICKGLGVEKPRRRALSERQKAELGKK